MPAASIRTNCWQRACKAVGYGSLAENLGPVSRNIQQLRWKMRLATGYVPEEVIIPKRFNEITTVKGPLDSAYLSSLMVEYAKAIRVLGQ